MAATTKGFWYALLGLAFGLLCLLVLVDFGFTVLVHILGGPDMRYGLFGEQIYLVVLFFSQIVRSVTDWILPSSIPVPAYGEVGWIIKVVLWFVGFVFFAGMRARGLGYKASVRRAKWKLREQKVEEEVRGAPRDVPSRTEISVHTPKAWHETFAGKLFMGLSIAILSGILLLGIRFFLFGATPL